MKREIGFEALVRDDRAVVTVGSFDGVHRGHQAILDYLRQRADAIAGVSVVVSFDPHPREVVRGERVPLLTTIEERGDVLEALGVERFVVLRFDKQMMQLDAEAFVEQILIAKVGLKEMVVGYDHGFGRGRQGNHTLLRKLGAQHGFGVDVIPEHVVGATTVSSTEVRRLVADSGEVAKAHVLLGRPYDLTGQVVQGAQRGRTIGFPTANLAPDPRKLIPAGGVYAVWVQVPGQPQPVMGMMNIGTRPTFDGATQQHLEVHLLKFTGDLYGQALTVQFVDRLRDEQRFESVAALVAQLGADRLATQSLLG